MSSLKKFVDQHRAEFDNREPGEEAWKKIDAELKDGKKASLWNNVALWRAAAVLFLGLSVFFFLTGNNSLAKRSEVAEIQTEFQDLESFYTDQIAEKVSLIGDIESFEGDDQYSQDIQKLEAMYQVLREQMKSQPSQKVKDALILNLLVRIDLLNQQLKKLEDSRKDEREQQSDV
jgi:hypothetical protein